MFRLLFPYPVTCQQFFLRHFSGLWSQKLTLRPAYIIPYGFPPAPRSSRTSPALAAILDKADAAFSGNISLLTCGFEDP
jgi:hypothetical protein